MGIKNLFQSLRNLLPGGIGGNGLHPYDRDHTEDEGLNGQHSDGEERQLFTALDVGTAYAKALIVEVEGEQGVVLGAGRHQQSYAHMSDGIVTDISGVVASCNEALTKAEKAAGGLVAPYTVIGIAGELVKGSSTTITRQRSDPTKPITPQELVRLTNAVVISVRIDGQQVTNPVGFRGRHFSLTLFSAYAPLMQLGALETVAQGLDLSLVAVVAEPYALARCLSTNASEDSGAIFIDIGGGTTDIALVRQGGIEETRMFALGGRTFTRRLATAKGVSVRDAESIKLSYSNGLLKGHERDEVAAILAPECQTWMDSVELLIDELAKGELLPPAIYLVGGGSALPDLREKLDNFPWTERLPFSRQPIIRTVQPDMVSSIVDASGLLKNAQDITPMALAYQVVELQNENSVLERALERVIHNMRI